MKDLVAFAGPAGSGKDEAATPLRAQGFELVKFADPMRAALEALDLEVLYRGCGLKLNSVIRDIGFDRAKREIPYVRHVLQRLGTEVGRNIIGPDVWVDVARNRIADLLYKGKAVVITDCRFENEADMVRDLGGLVIGINRQGFERGEHPSEQGIITDRVIDNTGSAEELHSKVLAVLASCP